MSSEELTQIDQELTKAATNMEYKALSSKVSFIPAGDGTVVGTAHYSIEAAEGFGHRFAYMMNMITVIDRD